MVRRDERQADRKQTALSMTPLLSIAWPLLVVGCFDQGAAAWALTFVPLHKWMGRSTDYRGWPCFKERFCVPMTLGPRPQQVWSPLCSLSAQHEVGDRSSLVTVRSRHHEVEIGDG